ncbi:MAG: hypothetical protein MJY41_00030 [Bacteroidales bacterium]|nr:hypothetical protein [Bacteroidales bacterium]
MNNTKTQKKSCYNVKTEKFNTILKWAKEKDPHENTPILIPTLGRKRGSKKTRLWPFGNVLLLKAAPESRVQSTFILDKAKWTAYIKEYNSLLECEKDYKNLGKKFFEWGTYWPAVLAICKAYQEDIKNI